MRWSSRRVTAAAVLAAVVVAAAIATADAVKLPPKLPATAVRAKMSKIKDACYRSATDCWTGTHKGSELWCISHPWSQVRKNEPCMRLLCEYFPKSFETVNWCGKPATRQEPVRPSPGNPDPKPEPPNPPEEPDPITPDPPQPDPIPPTPPPVVPKPPRSPDCRRAIKPLPASTTLEKLRMIRGACEHTSRDCWTGSHRHSELWCITHPWSQIDNNEDCMGILRKLFPRHFKCGGKDDPVDIIKKDEDPKVVDPRPGRKPCIVPRKLSLSAQREVKADCEAHLPGCFDEDGNVAFRCIHEGWSKIPDDSRCMETINRMFASKLPTAALAIVYAACIDTVHSCRDLEGDDYWTCLQANIKQAAGQCGQVVMEVTCRVTIVDSFEEKKEHEFKQEVKKGEPGCTPALASTRSPDASTAAEAMESAGETQVYHEVPIVPGETVVTPIQT